MKKTYPQGSGEEVWATSLEWHQAKKQNNSTVNTELILQYSQCEQGAVSMEKIVHEAD